MMKWIARLAAVVVAILAVIWLVKFIRFRLLADPTAVAEKELPLPPKPDSERTPNLNELLEPIRKSYKLPALAAAIIKPGGTTLRGAVGVRRAGHGERVNLDDRFHIGSCTKSMTATVCAILVEQGKLQWNTTIADTFPQLAAKIHPDYRAVTLEQLLRHRSGLPEDREPDAVLWPKICALTGPLKEQRRALVEMVLQQKPAAPPGTKFQYSNDGYTIAGAMCEQATGQVWEALMRERLFQPLRMTTAGFGPPGKPEAVDEPWGHLLEGQKWQPLAPDSEADNPPVIGPAGSVHCSIGDWARYAAFHLRGQLGEKKLLKPETLQKLHTAREGDDYAFGWLVAARDWAGGKALTHGGSNTFWFAVIWLAPARDSAFLAATNLGNDTAFAGCDAAIAKLIETTSAPSP
jgi:CubicO group peptidase (beta-lactamase class C family)